MTDLNFISPVTKVPQPGQRKLALPKTGHVQIDAVFLSLIALKVKLISTSQRIYVSNLHLHVLTTAGND